jgi:hypothetical protein
MLKPLLAVFLLVGVGGCATQTDASAALRDVNTEWRRQNSDIKRTQSTRAYDVSAERAYQAINNAFRALGFQVRELDRRNGLVFAVSMLPTPLTAEEWEDVRRIEEPEAKRVMARRIPISSMFAYLHTDEVEVHALGAVLVKGGRAEVSFEFTVVDHLALDMGFEANQELAPTATRRILEKLWRDLDRQLASSKPGS